MAKKDQLSLEERAKNYGNEIKQISDFVGQVRQTPDVYIGKVYGSKAFFTMFREILQNGLDEIMKGVAFSPNIYVEYDERNHQITVIDNGRGVPHGKIGIIFGESHTSSNYDKKPYEYSSGKNGMGASITCALSSLFVVDSYVVGEAVHVEFIEGHIWKKGEVKIKCPKDAQGTKISFIPNESVIGTIDASPKDVYDYICRIVPSSAIGTIVEYKGINSRGKTVISETIENKDGIMTYLINLTDNPYIEPIMIFNDDGEHRLQALFTYDISMDCDGETVISSNNTCPTDSGTHEEGCIDGITRWFRDYMNKIFLVNTKSKLSCTVNDIKQGLKLAICSCHLYASYDGQAKANLANPDMKPFCSQTIMNGLNEWSKVHPQDLQKLCKYFKEIIEIRMKQDKEKVKLSTKFEASSITGLPSKYLKPNGKKNCELIIVEGDSAFGAARNVRDAATQGIMPIRGKLPNVFEKSRAEILSNAEIAGMLTIMDAGYGKNFDLDKCKVDRVIIMADADPDGAHIRTLVLRFLFMYCKPLVMAGRVYAALPPLYGIPQGKGYKFFADKLDLVKYIQKEFSKAYTIQSTITKKALTTKEITSLLFNNADYVADLNKIANTYAIDPFFLEDILINRKLTSTKFMNFIEKKYRFIKCRKEGNVIMLSGVAYEKYHEVFVSQFLFNECKDIIPYIEKSATEYILNGQTVSLYTVMSEFNRFMPPKLDRYKGLGEMDPSMLAISTLRPDSDRVLVQYTVERYEQELEEMRYINSNKDQLLKD